MTLVKSISIDSLLQRRDGIVSELRKIRASVAAISLLAAATNEMVSNAKSRLTTNGMFCAKGAGYSHCPLESDADLDYSIRGVDSQLWGVLMEESGMLTFMHADARAKWYHQIRERECPPLTREAIEATFETLSDNKQSMFEKGVLAIAEGMNRNYKTNKLHKFSKRMVMPTGFYASGNTLNKLDDLDRALHILSGKPQRDIRQGLGEQFNGYGRARPYTIETDYLSMKVFKNSNAHITFKNLDLVDGLNRIIAKHHPYELAAPQA